MAKTKFYITTTAANETASFYLGKGQGVSSTVTATISWGDETESSTITISGSSSQASHSYAEPGNYEATITTTSNAVSIYRSDSVAALSANITRVHVGDYVNKIGKYAFYNTINLDTVIIGNQVTDFGQQAFYKSGIKHVTIGTGITELPNGAFSNCKGLIDVQFSEGLTTIGPNAFLSCSSIQEIKLPKSISHIDDNGFGSVGGDYINVYLYIKEYDHIPTISSVAFDGTNLLNLYVPRDAIDTGLYTGTDWDDAAVYIEPLPDPEVPSGVTPTVLVFNLNDTPYIALSTIEGYSNTADVFIDWGDGIGENVHVDSNEGVRIPHSYYYTDSSTRVTVSVYKIAGEFMFKSTGYEGVCNCVESLITGDGLISFGSSNMWRLQHIEFGSDFKIIGSHAFNSVATDDVGKIEINIPDTVEEIGEEAFYNANISRLTLGRGVTASKDILYETTVDEIVFKSETAPDKYDLGTTLTTTVLFIVPEVALDAYTEIIGEDPEGVYHYVVISDASPADPSQLTPTDITFTTTSANESASITLFAPYAIVCIDWGDGLDPSTETIQTYTNSTFTHTFASAGVYNTKLYITKGSAAISNQSQLAVSTNISSLVTGDGITEIGNGACTLTDTTLDKLHLINDVTIINDGAFNGSITVPDFIIGQNVTYIGEKAFKGLATTSDIVFNTPMNIHDNAFEGITAKNITISGNDIVFGDYVFYRATCENVILNFEKVSYALLRDSHVDSIIFSGSNHIDEYGLCADECNVIEFKSKTAPMMSEDAVCVSDGGVFKVPYQTRDAYVDGIESSFHDTSRTYTIEELPDSNRDPDEYDPDSIQDVPGDPAPEQALSGDAIKSILKAYGKNLKYIKTENNTIAVNTVRPGVLSITSDDLVIRSFNGYDFLECRSYDPFFGKPYYSLIRINDIRTFVIAQNARDQLDGFRC